jgi:hypothetical protein
VEALFHLSVCVLSGRFAVEAQVRQRGLLVPCRSWGDKLLEQPGMSLEDAEENLAQVQEHMEAVCHLHDLRRHATGGVRIFTAAIPADDVYSWMSEQPGSKLVATAVGQHIDDVVPLEVDQDSAIGPAAAEGEVVYTQNTWNRQLGQAIGAQVRQYRIG